MCSPDSLFCPRRVVTQHACAFVTRAVERWRDLAAARSGEWMCGLVFVGTGEMAPALDLSPKPRLVRRSWADRLSFRKLWALILN